MKPKNVLLVIVYVFAVLSIVMLIFPPKGIEIPGFTTLKFVSFKEIFNPEKIEYADISKQINVDLEEDKTAVSDSSKGNIFRPEVKRAVSFDEVIIPNADSIIQQIEYPEQNKEILYPFFKQLAGLRARGRLIRIIHYGDSQLEGDRVTSYLRYKLQNVFGGGGPGLLPLKQLINPQTITQRYTGIWSRYSSFGSKRRLSGKRYGLMSLVSKFSSANSSVSFFKSQNSYESNWRFNNVKLFYGNGYGDVQIKLYQNNQEIFVDTLFKSNTVKLVEWKLAKTIENIKIKFKGQHSPEFYGIALDANAGIAVDNIPIRGSSGIEFTKANKETLTQMYGAMNVGMIIMQFGINVVPSVLNNYGFYEQSLYKQLVRLKEVSGNVPIIMIGVSDMSYNQNGKFVSYPNIEKIRDVQKRAAFRAGCAFWDIYEAMGGKNSMPSWVYAKPPLATRDFTHFNPRGAKYIARMFYNALINDYNEYVKQKPS